MIVRRIIALSPKPCYHTFAGVLPKRERRFLRFAGLNHRNMTAAFHTTRKMADIAVYDPNMVFKPSAKVAERAHVSSMDQYREMYKDSIENPDGFWSAIAKDFYWKEEPNWSNVLQFNFDPSKGPIYTKWFEDGRTNIAFNCLDRNVERGLGDNVAFYWEGNDSNDSSSITYRELLREVCKFSNVLKSQGVRKGDRVAIYMPMITELVVAMLACARIGAIHSIIFGGFSSGSLVDRILDAQCKIIITADGTWRGTKLVHLKDIVDEALDKCQESGHRLESCIVVKHVAKESLVNGVIANGNGVTVKNGPVIGKRPYPIDVKWRKGDVWYHDLMAAESKDTFEPEWCNAEDPLFLLYTSGSTGKPKGVLHTIAGYMIYTATTFKYVFDHHPNDVYWCTADIGWITGHSYVTYGPLLQGATSVIFEGVPTHEDAGRFWAVVDKYKVSKFYTAPTAIRALMKFGNSYVTKYKKDSLQILGTVGEPINPEAWLWYHKVVGNNQCPIVDTFWQTETGGHVITPLPGCTPTKPGSATFPFFGVVPAIVNEQGQELDGEQEGYLVFKQPWPGIMRSVYGDHQRFSTTYFQKFPGYYCTGDGARRDTDGYFYITGRIDDMLNVSGHLLSTAEVESCLVGHEAVAESAVVAHPHEVKGECLYCFVTLIDGYDFTHDLETKLRNLVRTNIGPFACPDYIHFAPGGLPKTRSGKIMRRVLRKVAQNDRNLGDITTLADESVVEILFNTRPAEIRK